MKYNHLPVDPQQGAGLCAFLPLLGGVLFVLNLHHPCACCHSHVHSYLPLSCCVQQTSSLYSATLFDSYSISAPFSSMNSEPWK